MPSLASRIMPRMLQRNKNSAAFNISYAVYEIHANNVDLEFAH